MKAIIDYLEHRGYRCFFNNDTGELSVIVIIDGNEVCLLCPPQPNKIATLPIFLFKNATAYMPLAHVLLCDNSGKGFVCIGDYPSLSINFERPELVFEESLKRHIEIIRMGITDKSWNTTELLREFKANWDMLCSKKNQIVLPPNLQVNDSLTFSVNAPISGQAYGIGGKYIGVSDTFNSTGKFTHVYESATSKKRSKAGDAIIIPVNKLNPAPHFINEMLDWYVNIQNNIDSCVINNFKKWANYKRNVCWIVFCGDTPSGWTWVAIKAERKDSKRKCLPIKKELMLNWTLSPVKVIPYSRDFIAKRGGANDNLENKKVLLVGCGSVGSELARVIASSGVGRLELSDPDIYSEENLYRHCLSEGFIGCYKSYGLALNLRSQFLWLETDSHTKTLAELTEKNRLESFDLIIIAIGSPTEERLFNYHLSELGIKVPVIYTWVEGYGVGGHAILDCPTSAGCLKCAYIDHQSYENGLSSNLNFIEPGQTVTQNHAGCGQTFLPYSAISSMQTAQIAANLAIRYLMGQINVSSKVSWKGDDTDAKNAGIYTTYRYQAFNRSLVIDPLADPLCDCGGHH